MARTRARRARAALTRGFRDAIRRALAQVGRADRTPEAAVHEWRRALRRARAIVRLARPFLDGTTEAELAAVLRAAYKSGAKLRDTDVLARALAAEAGNATPLTRRVKAERARLRTRGEARARLSEHARAIATLPARLSTALSANIGVDELAGALARSYRRMRRAGRDAAKTRAADDVHAFRRRVKAFQYQLEVAQTVPGLDAGDARRGAARLAGALGEITDAQLVARLVIDSKAEVSARTRKRLLGALGMQRDKRLDRAFARAEPLTAVRPRRFRRRLLAR